MGRKKLDAYDPPRDPLVAVTVKIRKQLKEQMERYVDGSTLTWSGLLTGLCEAFLEAAKEEKK